MLIPKLYNGRDRTFFLFGWESYRQVIGQTRFARVLTELERQGDFSQTRDAKGALILLKDPLVSGACAPETLAGCFPGNQIPAGRFSPAAVKILPYYPLPNRPGMSNNYVTMINDTDRWDSFLYKIDHRLFSTDNPSFRFLKRYEYTNEPFRGNNLGNFGGRNDIHQSLFGLSYTRVFSPAPINEFRAAMTRRLHVETSDHLGHDYNGDFGITGATVDPSNGRSTTSSGWTA